MTTPNTIIAMTMLIITLAASQIWLSHLRIDTARQTHLTQKESSALLEEMQVLGLEYANLIRPERLRQLAHNKLGMNPPHPMQVLQP